MVTGASGERSRQRGPALHVTSRPAAGVSPSVPLRPRVIYPVAARHWMRELLARRRRGGAARTEEKERTRLDEKSRPARERLACKCRSRQSSPPVHPSIQNV